MADTPCIKCGYANSKHAFDGTCPGRGKRTVFASMDLPPGESCSTCVHVDRCTRMFGAKPGNTACDFYPVRFQKAEEKS